MGILKCVYLISIRTCGALTFWTNNWSILWVSSHVATIFVSREHIVLSNFFSSCMTDVCCEVPSDIFSLLSSRSFYSFNIFFINLYTVLWQGVSDQFLQIYMKSLQNVYKWVITGVIAPRWVSMHPSWYNFLHASSLFVSSYTSCSSVFICFSICIYVRYLMYVFWLCLFGNILCQWRLALKPFSKLVNCLSSFLRFLTYSLVASCFHLFHRVSWHSDGWSLNIMDITS